MLAAYLFHKLLSSFPRVGKFTLNRVPPCRVFCAFQSCSGSISGSKFAFRVIDHSFAAKMDPEAGKPMADEETLNYLKDMANKLRIHSINATNASNSGHPTSCCSMAEIMSVLFFHTMKYDIKKPRDPSSDRFVLSKGHAAPILYAAWAEAGLFPVSDLLNLRKLDSDLEGHPTPRLSFVDVATGSLGQGLSCAAGMAYAGKYFDKASFRVFCVIGDGEAAEGSIWEALSFAGIYKLDNLVAIFDINRLGQSEPTAFQHQIEIYEKRLETFGFVPIVVDGHDVSALCAAFKKAETVKGKPTAIIAKTFKGKGIPDIEDAENWHGKPLGTKANDAIAYITKAMKNPDVISRGPGQKPPGDISERIRNDITLSTPPAYKPDEKVATRAAYGTALVKLAKKSDRIIALDGDTKNSTFSEKLKKEFPDRYIECYIAEQNLVGVAVGCGCRERTIPFVSTFAAFFTRAFDQIRMAAISQSNIKCVGSHVGVSIGEDGPSQMGLEDIALFRSIPGCIVFYPSDAVSCERACELAANEPGICFIRTSRPATSILYTMSEVFVVGKSKIVRQSEGDKVLLIGAGVTLHECLKAADTLQKQGIPARVLDPFTIQPLDKDAIIKNARKCGGKIVVVEDHYEAGGLGEAVMSAVAMEKDIIVKHLAVRGIPRSGPPNALLWMFKIDSTHIIDAATGIINL